MDENTNPAAALARMRRGIKEQKTAKKLLSCRVNIAKAHEASARKRAEEKAKLEQQTKTVSQ